MLFFDNENLPLWAKILQGIGWIVLLVLIVVYYEEITGFIFN